MTGTWANDEEIATRDTFESLHSGLTVALIATPRHELMTCRPSEKVSTIRERNTENYDFIPVAINAGGSERIVGLFNAAKVFDATSLSETAERHFAPLSEEHLIGADGTILDFIRNADERPCRLVVSGARIIGLASLSDLQKLPVRAALFALITGFEITMLDTIKRNNPSAEEWLQRLSSSRRDKIKEEMGKSKKADGFIDALLFTQFCDKVEIVVKSFSLGESKGALRRELDDIQELRDKLAHANEYAATPEDARSVCAVVRSLLALRQQIASIGRDVADQTIVGPIFERMR